MSDVVVASIIARLGSRRLPYKNLLPFGGVSMLRRGVDLLAGHPRVDRVVVSTESDLVASEVPLGGKVVLVRRPLELAGDEVPSVPVFQHLFARWPGQYHLNWNINLPCSGAGLIDDALALLESGEEEVLSDPVTLWGQTRARLENYGDPWQITAKRFSSVHAVGPDVHTEEDWREALKKEGLLAWGPQDV